MGGELVGVDQDPVSQNVPKAAYFSLDKAPGEARVLGDDRPRSQKPHQLVADGREWQLVVEHLGGQADALGDVARHALARVDGRAEALHGPLAAHVQRGDVDHSPARRIWPGCSQ